MTFDKKQRRKLMEAMTHIDQALNDVENKDVYKELDYAYNKIHSVLFKRRLKGYDE